MATKHLLADLSSALDAPLKLSYIDVTPSASSTPKGTILLIHGFPQTSHQFRHVWPLVAAKGYRCIIPDYRGAGASSKDVDDFRKTAMARDLIALLDYLGLQDEPVHVIGHDIGGMIAFALASRYPDRVKSVLWGECPLPGTTAYERAKTEKPVQYFHFHFHSVADLPEALVAGRERLYVEHFLRKITHNLMAFSEADVDDYAKAYARPGAMRCAFGVYRAFEGDAAENQRWVQEKGKCAVRTMVLSGEQSILRAGAEEMAREVTEEGALEVGVVEGADHYLAEENPKGFVDVIVEFVSRQE